MKHTPANSAAKDALPPKMRLDTQISPAISAFTTMMMIAQLGIISPPNGVWMPKYSTTSSPVAKYRVNPANSPTTMRTISPWTTGRRSAMSRRVSAGLTTRPHMVLKKVATGDEPDEDALLADAMMEPPRLMGNSLCSAARCPNSTRRVEIAQRNALFRILYHIGRRSGAGLPKPFHDPGHDHREETREYAPDDEFRNDDRHEGALRGEPVRPGHENHV